MGRELSTFTDLQNSLAQLGFNNGNVLLRLSFRRTEEPLEMAMVKIQDYFKTVEDEMATETATQEKSASQPAQSSEDAKPQPPTAGDETTGAAPAGPKEEEEGSQPVPQVAPAFSASSNEPAVDSTTASRPMTVFSPPSSSIPQSAQVEYNESDYLPSVEHAQAHQRRLNATSKPTRLPTDAEIAAKARAEEERVAFIQEVDVKVRLPDQSQLVAKFGQQDTGKSLYDFVRSCLTESFVREKFFLALFPTPGNLGSKKAQNVVPDSDRSLLIKDLGMVGRVLVSCSWDASVSSSAAQESKTSLLRPELRSQAQQLKVEQPADIVDSGATVAGGSGQQQPQQKPARKPGALPKWLKLPGKK